MEVKIYYLFVMFIFGKTFESQTTPYFKAINVDNWTTCEEFVNNTSFNASSVVDIDWQIFFFWNWIREESYHIKFSIPTPTLLAHFREHLDKDLKPQVDWNGAELFMETSIDFSALLVRTNDSGMYRLIPSLLFEYRDMPTPFFALKMSEAGYLGLVNCKYRLCYALAPVDKMPDYHDLEEAAKTLNFYGEYNRTFLDSKTYTEPEQEHDDEPDYLQDDDDAEVEISAKDQLM